MSGAQRDLQYSRSRVLRPTVPLKFDANDSTVVIFRKPATKGGPSEKLVDWTKRPEDTSESRPHIEKPFKLPVSRLRFQEGEASREIVQLGDQYRHAHLSDSPTPSINFVSRTPTFPTVK